MNKHDAISLLTAKMKLIRTEKGYTQDKMSEILGISKKTLVQIEKGRASAGWTVTVAVCALFKDSDILKSTFGDDPLEVIETLAHDQIDRPKEKTLGGKVWWKQVKQEGPFRLQQNVISQHYRILDDSDHRWYSSFDEADAETRFSELTKTENG